MRRVILVLVLVAAGVVTARAEPAFACSCVLRDPSELLTGDIADAVFVGTVLVAADPPTSDIVSSAEIVELEFDVEAVYRGELPNPLLVRTVRMGSSCGLGDAAVGARIGLALRRDGDGWEGGLCDQIDPAALGEAGEPRSPIVVSAAEDAETEESGWPMALGVGAVVVGVGALVIALIARRRGRATAAS